MVMSNEYKDWINDKVCDTLFDTNVIDRVDEICTTPYSDRKYVYGWKDGHKVAFMVWMDADGEWKFEHREIEK
jgi:hypothetical protein